ncbi:MAG TPA: transcriptional regulator [Sphingomonas sp.]|jgi:DNA-binding winged helix-turn-helix (wHTH) protein
MRPAYRFDRFRLDPDDRRLLRDGEPVELNARYLDALALLVREAGRLIPKDRFLQEVWRGVPVTDEALTQCVRSLRRALGDDAQAPRFIETVPKHGYRFVALVTAAEDEPAPAPSPRWRDALAPAAAGTAGGVAAGVVGGLFYGFALASGSPGTEAGGASAVLVLVAATTAVALLGGAGVASGIALAGLARSRRGLWTVAGGAAGGLVVGALVRLVGMDAFRLLVGRSPAEMTGAPEGALLGAAVGLGVVLGSRGSGSLRRAAAWSALSGGAAGLAVPLLGGELLGGSLLSLVERFPDARLRLDPLGSLVGEAGFGPVAQAVTGGLEGALFAGSLAAAMRLARRDRPRSGQPPAMRAWNSLPPSTT